MKPVRRRSESYLGIHFDFHVQPDSHPMGNNPRPDIFAKMLDAVDPDFMQCDTKGHPGYASYPTKAGVPAPGMQVDVLKMLRGLTRERGIALYGHHSGLYDLYIAQHHPDWAVVHADGTVSTEHLSAFSPFWEKVLVPQLLELAVDYELDGAWVDGECWATEVDYSAHAKAAWKEKTGRDDCPVEGDADYEDYREFCRQGFRDYVGKYVAAVKAVRPDFQITSNWLFSGMMPEKPTVAVDYLSGDYLARDSYNSARFHARCLMHQGLTWDLMAWGHNAPETWLTDDRSTKEAPQYCQEAAQVLALGGGFQFFNQQYDGGCLVQEWAIPIWKETAEFCRAREPYCFRAQAVPQVGVLYSDGANRLSMPQLFGDKAGAARLKSLMNLCAETQLTSDIVLSHHVMDGKLPDYGLLLVPDSEALEPEVLQKIEDYVENGGKLLLCGPKAIAQLGGKWGLTTTPIDDDKLIFAAYGGRMAAYQGYGADFAELCGWQVLENYHEGNFFESPAHPMLVHKAVGKGAVCALNFDLGHLYINNKTTLIRKLMLAIADKIFPERMVRVTGSMYADLTLMRKNGSLMLNIVNAGGPHADATVRSFEEIPPLPQLHCSVKLEKAPASVTLQPEGKALPWVYEGGAVHFDVPRVDIHSIVEIK